MQASRRITRKSASNLALAFVLLPKAKRAAMTSLYAFCRQVDDVADDEQVPTDQRREHLAQWRDDIRQACSQGQPRFPVNQELQPVIRQYQLPYNLFDELIQGVEMDLDIHRYANYADLELYCYRVASVVGLLSIEIFGYRNLHCRDYAIALGKALQLTNILRDVHEDAQRDRIYLPQTALRDCQVRNEDILAGRFTPAYQQLARQVAARTRQHYHNARSLLAAEDRQAMIAAELMGTVYWRLLQNLDRRQFDVFQDTRVRVSQAFKVWLILRTWWRILRRSPRPNYGDRSERDGT